MCSLCVISIVNSVVLLLVEERTGCSMVCVWSVVKSCYGAIGEEYMLEYILLVLWTATKTALKDPGIICPNIFRT